MATRVRLTIAGIAAGLVITMWGCTELSDEHRVHPGNWGTEHQAKVQTVNYDFTFCQSCHGDDLEGDAETPGCSGSECHKVDAGQSVLEAIYACNNCHGYVDDIQFEDVAGNSSTDSVTVGAHTSHYTNPNSLTVNVDCASCHVVPDSVFADGHLFGGSDTTARRAEVFWSSLATGAGSTRPAWDRQAATCSQVYCHGSFDFGGITGKDSSWLWTTPAAGDLCGTCHELPPPAPHPDNSSCGQCHSGVVSRQDHRTIIDPAKHINGLKN